MTHPHERALEAAARAIAAQWALGDKDLATFTPHALARAAVTAYLDALQETHALVPREPTRAMTLAWAIKSPAFKGTGAAHQHAREVWSTMIDAAPPAAQEKK
jgi:hypothetical protein